RARDGITERHHAPPAPVAIDRADRACQRSRTAGCAQAEGQRQVLDVHFLRASAVWPFGWAEWRLSHALAIARLRAVLRRASFSAMRRCLKVLWMLSQSVCSLSRSRASCSRRYSQRGSSSIGVALMRHHRLSAMNLKLL